MCSLKSSDIALFWKYNDYGSLAEELELYIDSIFFGTCQVLKRSLSSLLGFFLCELQDKSKITDHNTATQSFVERVYL